MNTVRSLSKNKLLTTIGAVGIILLAVFGIARTAAAAIQQSDLQAESSGIVISDAGINTGIDGCNGDCAACGLCTEATLPVTEDLPETGGQVY